MMFWKRFILTTYAAEATAATLQTDPVVGLVGGRDQGAANLKQATATLLASTGPVAEVSEQGNTDTAPPAGAKQGTKTKKQSKKPKEDSPVTVQTNPMFSAGSGSADGEDEEEDGDDERGRDCAISLD